MDRIRELVRQRMEERRLNMREVSLLLKKNHAYMQQFLEKGTPATLPENVREELAAILGLDQASLKEGGQNPPKSQPNQQLHYSQKTTTDQIPVLGMAEGGKDGWELWNGDVVAYVPRPIVLAGVPKAYAIYAIGPSMEPRYHPGEMLFINPVKPAQIGSYVLVEKHPADEGEGPRAVIKRLVKRSATKITLEQYSPPKTFEVRLDEIKHIHRIVGSADA